VDKKPLGGSIKNVLPKKKKEKISCDNRKNKNPYLLVDKFVVGKSLKNKKYLMKYTYINYKKNLLGRLFFEFF
jgi:hypothetical protein